MTSPYLASDLKIFEGFRAVAYPDPLSKGPPWTIGYGHTGREVHPGLAWTEPTAASALAADIANTCRGLDTALSWWRTLDDLRQDCIVNQAFNLGVHGLLGFGGYLALVKAGNYAAAADDDIHTLWARQVGDRAKCVCEQVRTGEHQLPV